MNKVAQITAMKLAVDVAKGICMERGVRFHALQEDGIWTVFSVKIKSHLGVSIRDSHGLIPWDKVDAEKMITCPVCAGDGQVEQMYDVDKGGSVECPRCRGEKQIEVEQE